MTKDHLKNSKIPPKTLTRSPVQRSLSVYVAVLVNTVLKSLLSAFTYTKNVTCGVTKANKCHKRTLSTVCCCCYFFRHNAIQLAKVGPTFSSLSPCPSLPSVETGERRLFQCLNIVLNNKTGPLFLKCNKCEKNFSFLIAKSMK